MVILAGGSALLLLILIVGIASIACCLRTTQKVLPPADLIPKVRASCSQICPVVEHSRSVGAHKAPGYILHSFILDYTYFFFLIIFFFCLTLGPRTQESVMTLKAHSLPHAKGKSGGNGGSGGGQPTAGGGGIGGNGMAKAGGACVPSMETTSVSPMDGLPDYQESNSGSYSTTTTISINKNDLLLAGGRMTLPHPHQAPPMLSSFTAQSAHPRYISISINIYMSMVSARDNYTDV